MKEQFIDWKPRGATVDLIEKILEVLDQYEKMGYRLTLRQLYYQLVSRDFISNNIKSYNMIGNIVSQARLAGIIDWDRIEDRVRTPKTNTHWRDPQHILKAAADSYYLDRWEGQADYVEVWCEKDAVSNIILPVCRKWDVLFMANRGYSSQSAMYDAYKRIYAKLDDGVKAHVIYLGDHDPSGMDMGNDICTRLGLFIGKSKDMRFKNFDRIALTMEQIRKYDPPENPAKKTDSRYEKYSSRHGTSSWELDALQPQILADLVEAAITKYLDPVVMEKVITREGIQKARIKALADTYKEEDHE